MEFLEYLKTSFSIPETWLPGSGGRSDRSTGPRVGRLVGRPTCTGLCTFGQGTGPVDRAVDRPESFALWKTSVDRPVDRSSPTVDFSTVGGRPPAVSGCKNSPTAIFWRGLFKPDLFGFLTKIFKSKNSRVSLVF